MFWIQSWDSVIVLDYFITLMLLLHEIFRPLGSINLFKRQGKKLFPSTSILNTYIIEYLHF